MFDKFFDFISQVWIHIVPFTIISEYESGVKLRFGKLKNKFLNPGLHWKIPIIDNILITIVTKDTLAIQPVNITTIDNKTITVGAILEFEITDVIKYLIETNEPRSNTHDICRGIIADSLTDSTYEQCKDKKTIKAITKLITKKCETMGISVLMLTFTDFSISRVVKLFGNIQEHA